MSGAALIDTDALSARYRAASVDVERRSLLVSRLRGSQQEADLTVAPNCEGFGRIRHFRRTTSSGWPPNPLPIDPARKALGLPTIDLLRAQAFQNAACNWRCWYCYVPFNLLAADAKYADWLTAGRLVDLYLDQPEPPPVIDLTGGQPDLVPEWVPWMMSELRARGLEERVYHWSDDNLSTDYLWRFLSQSDLEVMVGYQNYGRVGCFKGFDAHSFSFNTLADPALFERQFEVMGRLIDLGLDVYAYATFTTPARPMAEIRTELARFVDRLQALDEHLPLRTVPLEIQTGFSPVRARIRSEHERALSGQVVAIAAWHQELAQRFTDSERARNVADLPLRSRR